VAGNQGDAAHDHGFAAGPYRFEVDARDALDHLKAEGFTIEAMERSRVAIVELVRVRKPGGERP
jgi:hypothetical protein